MSVGRRMWNLNPKDFGTVVAARQLLQPLSQPCSQCNIIYNSNSELHSIVSEIGPQINTYLI